MQRTLKLCRWADREALPTVGKEYQQGVKLKPPAGQVDLRLLRRACSQQRDQPVRGLMWCPAVAPRKSPQAPCSSQEATQPAASEPGPCTPPPANRSKRTKAEQAAEPTQPTEGKAAKAKPAPQPGRWLDRNCNAALNMQRIGESRWRPLQLCYWPDQGALPAKGKEYPGLGYNGCETILLRPSSSSSLLRHRCRAQVAMSGVLSSPQDILFKRYMQQMVEGMLRVHIIAAASCHLTTHQA
ncbi:hypothetical protein QJQ45_010069 [Haematococcus lacustris]|nr:hypothetical protein QJQ45_010069 [Haematococcus lacustris]